MKHILVIDDDEQVRTLVGRFISGSGYSVELADNGMTGIAAMRRTPADLVITDIIMPEKEGVETIMELRRDFPQVKIIAMSGGSPQIQPDLPLRIARTLGADRILHKPFTRDALLTMVNELISP
jgi:CheY-like chemotaxis protein